MHSLKCPSPDDKKSKAPLILTTIFTLSLSRAYRFSIIQRDYITARFFALHSGATLSGSPVDGRQEAARVSEGESLDAALAAELGRVREPEAALVAELGQLQLGAAHVVGAASVVVGIFAI